MGDEDGARVYGGILLSHAKGCSNANCSTRMASFTVSEAGQRQVSYDITYGRESRSVVSDALSPPKDYTVHGILQARILEWVAFPFSRGIFPTQGSDPGLLHGRWILLPAEPARKPKNTAVGSLSLLQGLFPTQESDWGLLHCRRPLYQLSYEGRPRYDLCVESKPTR